MKDSVSAVCLPGDLYFSGKQTGIDSKLRDTANVLSGVACYNETALKLARALQAKLSDDSNNVDAKGVQAQLDDLMLTLIGQMRYLQERQAGLVVAGSFGPKAK